MWEYERDAKREYRGIWNVDNRKRQTEYRRRYRQEHREATLEQWRKDSQRYRSRQDPELLKRRNVEYQKRYKARKKAEQQAMQQRKDDDMTFEQEDRLIMAMERIADQLEHLVTALVSDDGDGIGETLASLDRTVWSVCDIDDDGLSGKLRIKNDF